MNDHLPNVPADSRWPRLKASTPARIGIRRAGGSISTTEALALQLAHAAAHDALIADMGVPAIEAALRSSGFETVAVRSEAIDRATYIRRPDLGRLVDEHSRLLLVAACEGRCDAVFILADGLSSAAVERNAVPLLRQVHPRLVADEWALAPVIVASQARVAISDQVGAALSARLAVILIGERPGLSSVDSMGIYVTWDPQPGRLDADRNCISNVHPGGLALETAADQLYLLMRAAHDNQLTGTGLSVPIGCAQLVDDVAPELLGDEST